MDLSTFEDLLDHYGGDLGRWPADLRVEAAVLLETSPQSRVSLDATSYAEAYLRVRATSEAGAFETTAARAMTTRQATPARRIAIRAGWAAAAVLLLALGISLGEVPAPEHDESPGHIMAVALETPVSADVE